MHFMAKRPEFDTGIETRPDEESQALRDEARDRQAAALCLRAAAMAEDAATRKSLQQRAAELVLPRPGGQWRTRPGGRAR
jgi:hypothetical protein